MTTAMISLSQAHLEWSALGAELARLDLIRQREEEEYRARVLAALERWPRRRDLR
jgi:hypothetical protein